MQLKDANGNNLTNSDGTVSLSTTAGTLGAVTDNGNGTYSATLTSATTAGSATISGKLRSTTLTHSASVSFTAGAVSTNLSTIIATPTSLPSDGVTTSTVTVTLKDVQGNYVSGKVITLSANTGASTISIVNATTNSSGNASFIVKDSVSEQVTYTAMDTTDSITLHDTVTVIYTAPPATPGTPFVVPGNHEVNVSWIQNLSKGDPKTYEVTATPGGATCRVSFPGKVFSSASCSVVGLTNGKSYTFRVKATNDWGSALSNPSNAATPQSLFDGSCGTANGVATLTEPTGFLCNTGTSSLVQSDQGKFIWTCTGSGSGSTASCSANGEETGGKTITLTTPVGNNCAIQKAGPVPAPAGGPVGGWVLPYELLNYEMVNCSASRVTVVLTFSGVVERMTYWKHDSGGWRTIPSKDIVLAGNTATFSIDDNGIYDEDPAIGSIVDPSAPGFLPRLGSELPGAPVNPSATAGDTKATISWQAPRVGGIRAPVRYTVTSLPDNLTCTVLAPLTSCSIKGLTNEVPYTFTVVAENNAGVGAPSSTTNSVTPTYSVSPGACGIANSVSSLTKPTINLCSKGVASNVTANAGSFDWTCAAVGNPHSAICSAPGASAPGGNVTTTFELQTPSGCALQKAGIAQPAIGKPIGMTLLNGLVSYNLQNCTSLPVIRLTYSRILAGMSLWEANNQTWLTINNAKLSGKTVLYSIIDNGSYDIDPILGSIAGSSGPGTGNTKQSQSSLVLSSKKYDILSGRSVTLSVNGGNGKGKLNYIAHSTGGSSCAVISAGNNVLLKTSGTTSGTCSVWAIKDADITFSAESSNPITINVNCLR